MGTHGLYPRTRYMYLSLAQDAVMVQSGQCAISSHPVFCRRVIFPPEVRGTRGPLTINRKRDNSKQRLDTYVSVVAFGRWVPWCSGYHVCLTRRRSRVRASLEPNNSFPRLSSFLYRFRELVEGFACGKPSRLASNKAMNVLLFPSSHFG